MSKVIGLVMDISLIRKKIELYISQGKSLFCTSSFQSHSIVLLHILSRIDNSIPVYFINTGYHFAETIAFKNSIESSMGIRVINLNSMVPKIMQRNDEGNLLFTTNPVYCCYLNKVQPVENLLNMFDVWINGIRADQNESRRNVLLEQFINGNKTIRYHPMLDWTREMVEKYIAHFRLPRHPLEKKGYRSIGCEPCTQPASFKGERSGRWPGQKQTECGLNDELL
ncbi:MAG TPA: phosphoadenylyl-sulfate reductase [Bacteroidales bacterium]|nr:phosphoadenylyl-sulfate reductase [Bacteroidales bacterium]